ncbi:MAG: FAD binding domain-containing protein [Phycisphaerae bacterium]
MYLPNIQLHEVKTLKEASGLLVHYGDDARLLAGGTDLLVDLKTRRIQADHLVSINRVDGLRGIERTDGSLRIGALTTITELCRSPIIHDHFAPILDAASQMAAAQVRNMATVGGNLASAVPCADLPPILMVMNASVELWSPAGERSVPLDSFFAGPRQTFRRDDEVLTAIVVPRPPARFGAAYARFALRAGNAIAVAGVAAGFRMNDDKLVHEARIALGAVSPTPKCVPAAADCLIGERITDDILDKTAAETTRAADPISDVRGSADYRREIVDILTRRAVTAAGERAGASYQASLEREKGS